VRPKFSPVFFREHVRIEVGDPLLAFLRHPQIPECIADIGTDGLPEESRVRCSQIIGSLIPELFARAGFLKFGKQRGRLAQIVNVRQLADQIRGTKQAWIICCAGMLLVLRYGKTRVLDIGLDFSRVDVDQAYFAEALADKELRSRDMIGGQRCVRGSRGYGREITFFLTDIARGANETRMRLIPRK
jgi:hypothetical protein